MVFCQKDIFCFILYCLFTFDFSHFREVSVFLWYFFTGKSVLCATFLLLNSLDSNLVLICTFYFMFVPGWLLFLACYFYRWANQALLWQWQLKEKPVFGKSGLTLNDKSQTAASDWAKWTLAFFLDFSIFQCTFNFTSEVSIVHLSVH